MPSVGDPAPEIDAPTTGGGRFVLSDQRGKWVIVFFYVRALTPGWCHEASDFQEHLAELESLNALVVGVSADGAKLQQSFIDKFSLTFPMVPDPTKKAIDDYGARAVLGIVAKRSTFLVDPEGRVAAVWPAVNVERHAEDVIATIRRLSGWPPGRACAPVTTRAPHFGVGRRIRPPSGESWV
jgi:thioredoxin-dependent peroxiredoxin